MRSSSNISKVNEDREAGMEATLMRKIEKVDFKQQMKMFYTAYSKVRTSLLTFGSIPKLASNSGLD